jgi:hypothetical protein
MLFKENPKHGRYWDTYFLQEAQHGLDGETERKRDIIAARLCEIWVDLVVTKK